MTSRPSPAPSAANLRRLTVEQKNGATYYLKHGCDDGNQICINTQSVDRAKDAPSERPATRIRHAVESRVSA